MWVGGAVFVVPMTGAWTNLGGRGKLESQAFVCAWGVAWAPVCTGLIAGASVVQEGGELIQVQ